jgi:hypothetical protein
MTVRLHTAFVYLYLTPLLFAGSYLSRAKHLYSVPQASLVVNNSRIWASGITVQTAIWEVITLDRDRVTYAQDYFPECGLPGSYANFAATLGALH